MANERLTLCLLAQNAKVKIITMQKAKRKNIKQKPTSSAKLAAKKLYIKKQKLQNKFGGGASVNWQTTGLQNRD